MLLPGMWAALVLATGGAVSVPAAPTVRASVTGACPTAAELRSAFDGGLLHFTVEGTAPGWTLSVVRSDATHTSHLSLRDESGALAFERDVEGDDCAAIAGAAAAITEAYFMRIHLVGAPASPPPPPAKPPPPPPRPSWWLSFGLSGGGVLYVDPSLGAWSGEASFGLRHQRLGMGIAAFYASPTVQRTPLDEVHRTELGVRLDGTYRLGSGRFWLDPGLGLSILHSEVSAITLPEQPPAARLDFGVGVVLNAGFRLSDSLSLTATATGMVLVLRDQYVIEPDGIVASSPGARFFAGLGLRFELPL